jgi:CubicO group peptidase (beta-lactamase class C family)
VKVFLLWAVLAVIVAAILVIAHDPASQLQRLGLSGLTKPTDSAALDRPPPPGYPSEVVHGSDQPAAPRESPVSESLDPAGLQSAAQYAAEHDSLALIVSRHGYIVFEKYWRGSDFNTVVDSGPLARVLTALATGAAVSARKVGWPDEPIGYLAPTLRQDPRGAITVRNLLQMTSGLATAPASIDSDIIAHYQRLPQAAPPGQRWLNQSADPELLAYVLERATGQRYAQFISQTIWRPIGAADASLWVDGSGGAAHVDRGFMARQGDWMRVAEVLLSNGRFQGDEIVVPKWMPQMLQPVAANPGFGMYLRLGSRTAPGMTPYVATDVFVIEGGGHRIWLVPSLQIAILRTGPRAADWDDGRLANYVIRAARDFVPAAARPGAELRQLVPNH